jgi:hypothetical protein
MKHFLIALLGLLIATPALADPNGAGPTPGTAGTQSAAAGCIYHASPTAASEGQQRTVLCDVNGNLLTTATASLTGTTSNAGSGVATSSTNVPTVSYNYGFNGTTWDQLQVDASKNLKVVAAPLAVTSTDASGTVATGGTYQTVQASTAGRKGCLIQNPTTATEIVSIKVGTMASPFTVPAGGTFSCSSPGGTVITDAITLTAATATHAFAAVFQ